MKRFSTLDANDEVVAIEPGRPFATHWVIVRDAAEAVYSGKSIGQRAAMRVNHAWDALDKYGPDTLSRYLITVEEVDDPAPTEVSRLQALLALDAAGLLDDVEAAVAASPRAVQIYYAEAPVFHRTHPTLLQIAAALSPPLDDTAIDALFLAAAAL